MVSSVDDDMQITVNPLQRQAPEKQTEHNFRKEVRDLIEKLRSLAPDDPSTVSPRGGALAPRARKFDIIDVQEFKEGWPRGLVFVAQLLAIVCLLVAIVYGPPYYSCRQMKERGMFYYGTTVGTCVRDSVSAQNERLETFARKVARSL